MMFWRSPGMMARLVPEPMLSSAARLWRRVAVTRFWSSISNERSNTRRFTDIVSPIPKYASPRLHLTASALPRRSCRNQRRRRLQNLLRQSRKRKLESTRPRLRLARKLRQRKLLLKRRLGRRVLPKRAAKRKNINFHIKGIFQSWHTKKD